MSELIDVVLPPDQVEGTRSQVQRWLKAVGEPAKRHEPLVEIETDKVTVEVPSPADGVLAEIVAAEGVDVEPGAVLARLRAAAAAGRAGCGRGRAHVTRRGRGRRARGRRRAAAARLSPAVRRLLAERGLSAGQVKGSGEGGRITVEDVLAARLDAAASATLAARTRRRNPPRRASARAAHADAPAHRRAHGREPPAHGAARDERVPVRHVGRARRSRGAQGGIRAPRPVADLDRLFRRGLRRRAARRPGSEWPLERGRDPAQRSHGHRHRHGPRGPRARRSRHPRRGRARPRGHRGRPRRPRREGARRTR